jgi:hypothetical protein
MQCMLAFIATQLLVTKNLHLESNLLDNKTGNNIQHTTYLVIVFLENIRFSQKPFMVIMGISLWNLFRQK